MLRDLVHIDWHGLIGNVVGYWDTYVRPNVQWIFHTVISTPLDWIGIDFEVPLPVRDYLTLGFIFVMSVGRWTSLETSSEDGLRDPFYVLNMLGFLLAAPLLVVFWLPLSILYLGFVLQPRRWLSYYLRKQRVKPSLTPDHIVGLLELYSPFIYVGALAALNMIAY